MSRHCRPCLRISHSIHILIMVCNRFFFLNKQAYPYWGCAVWRARLWLLLSSVLFLCHSFTVFPIWSFFLTKRLSTMEVNGWWLDADVEQKWKFVFQHWVVAPHFLGEVLLAETTILCAFHEGCIYFNAVRPIEIVAFLSHFIFAPCTGGVALRWWR